jgi:hypothetical protein
VTLSAPADAHRVGFGALRLGDRFDRLPGLVRIASESPPEKLIGSLIDFSISARLALEVGTV